MNIALIGYGKMGKVIEKIALERGHIIVSKIQKSNAKEMDNLSTKVVDVAIEFTNPEVAFQNVRTLISKRIPTVCGSTGWLSRYDEIVEYANQQECAFIHASNFSVGVNILFHLNEQVARILNHYPTYKASIKETHHTSKKDAPSGTAIVLARGIITQHDQYDYWENKKHTEPHILPIHSVRKDPAPGTHEIKYKSSVDTIELIHTAHNRNGFGLGALLAAEYIQNKSGIFAMKDVLGFHQSK